MLTYYLLTISHPWDSNEYKYFHYFDNMKKFLKKEYLNDKIIQEKVAEWQQWRKDRIEGGYSTPEAAQQHINFIIKKLYKDIEALNNLSAEQLQKEKCIFIDDYRLSYETILTVDEK